MKRPLSLVLAASLVAGTMAISIAPAAAQNFGVQIGVGGWDNDRWHEDDGYRYRHHRHRHHGNAPGFSLNLGVPYAEPRAYYHHRRHYQQNCWENWHGNVVCQ